MAEVKATQVSRVASGTGTVVHAEGKAIAIFNVGGTFYAIANACTHMGGPLGEGHVEGTTITCPWHGSQFDVNVGPSDEGTRAQTRGHIPGAGSGR